MHEGGVMTDRIRSISQSFHSAHAFQKVRGEYKLAESAGKDYFLQGSSNGMVIVLHNIHLHRVKEARHAKD
jgi:hypothetical protein